MTKIELVDQVSQKVELPKKEAVRVLECIIDTVQATLKAGEKVSLTGLGTFTVREKSARMARNPKTGEQVLVPARRAPKFKPAKELKELLA